MKHGVSFIKWGGVRSQRTNSAIKITMGMGMPRNSRSNAASAAPAEIALHATALPSPKLRSAKLQTALRSRPGTSTAVVLERVVNAPAMKVKG